jgi:pimeloyl-ACP methyl ester carboxylesterase
MNRLRNLLLLSALAVSCQDEASPKEDPAEIKTYFVSATPMQEVPLPLLQLFAASTGYDEVGKTLKYGIKSYRLVYKTTYKGKVIDVSGLILLPKDRPDAAPIISVQHGTTFIKDEAPTTSGPTGIELLASAGYIALMPDYIGYGESSAVFHPYYDKDHSARTVIDMIRAAKEYLVKQNISFSDDLFLTGYSEGGYVTLAAARAIESTPDYGLHLTGVAAGAGGYDLTDMLHGLTTNSHYSYPSYLAFVIMSYNSTNNWSKPLTYFFNQPYADALAKYMNGQYGGGFINSKLTTSVDKLFNTQFFSRLKTTDGEQELKQALIQNTVSGWKTETPIRLFHGAEDEIIPYHNSEATLESFKSAGSHQVTLTPIPGGTHGNSFVPMLEEIIPWLEML